MEQRYQLVCVELSSNQDTSEWKKTAIGLNVCSLSGMLWRTMDFGSTDNWFSRIFRGGSKVKGMASW